MTNKKTLQMIHEEKDKTVQKTQQKLALMMLQKQIQNFKLKEYLIFGGFIGGAALLRIPMQIAPSVEPLMFFAILSGWLFGKKKGFIVGVTSLYLSNFFMIGGQGPWTIFQAAGFGMGGFLGGFLRNKATIIETLVITLIATLLYEIIVNIGSLMIFPIGILTIFFTALPFTLIHIFSNAIFSLFLPYAKKIVEEKGGLNERHIYRAVADRISSTPGLSWLFKPRKEGK